MTDDEIKAQAEGIIIETDTSKLLEGFPYFISKEQQKANAENARTKFLEANSNWQRSKNWPNERWDHTSGATLVRYPDPEDPAKFVWWVTVIPVVGGVLSKNIKHNPWLVTFREWPPFIEAERQMFTWLFERMAGQGEGALR